MVSQGTLKNVGISALISAYTLINADYTTARQVIQTILNAAEKRLNNEFVLSKKVEPIDICQQIAISNYLYSPTSYSQTVSGILLTQLGYFYRMASYLKFMSRFI